MKIILASGSPRRNEMLKNLGIPFEKMSVSLLEKNQVEHEKESFSLLAMENAFRKANEAAGSLNSDEEVIVIGADTIVVHEGKILPKPSDDEEARIMLEKLSGVTHVVITGLALVRVPSGEVFRGFEQTRVTFRTLTPEDIDMYITTGEHADKAGAYGIQEYGAFLVERVEGDYFNVVGLPLVRLYNLMKQAGVDLFKLATGTKIKDS